jgi:hypothetical protein
MKTHLAQYKRERLGIFEEGIHYRTQKTYAHVLPPTLKRLNILETFRAEFWRYFDANSALLPLHTDFHHLNSSQGFAFNLLFPYFEKHRRPQLLKSLQQDAREVRSLNFEAMPNPFEGTTLDLLIEVDGGRRILIEVKLSETAFGKCICNPARLRKLREIYSVRLSGCTAPENLEESTFFNHYQLFRNVSALDRGRGDQLVLLLPRANTLAWQDGARFCTEVLNRDSRVPISLIAAEDLWRDLSLNADGPVVRAHLDLLAEKYLLAEPSGRTALP